MIGICDTPSGLGTTLAGLFGVPKDEVRLDYAGLNHLGWLRAAHHQDRDLVQELLTAYRRTNPVLLGRTHLSGCLPVMPHIS